MVPALQFPAPVSVRSESPVIVALLASVRPCVVRGSSSVIDPAKPDLTTTDAKDWLAPRAILSVEGVLLALVNHRLSPAWGARDACSRVA